MIVTVTCGCGNVYDVECNPDYEAGQYYMVSECEACGFYEEGFYGSLD